MIPLQLVLAFAAAWLQHEQKEVIDNELIDDVGCPHRRGPIRRRQRVRGILSYYYRAA